MIFRKFYGWKLELVEKYCENNNIPYTYWNVNEVGMSQDNWAILKANIPMVFEN